MRWPIAVLAIALSAGCAGTPPVGERRDPEFSAQLDNILIIGISDRAERRRAFEEEFVLALAARDISATASHTIIESASGLTRGGVEQAISGKGFGAVLVTRLAGVEQSQIEQLPTINRRYRSFSGYYDHVLQQNNAGYYARFRAFSLESHLYETATERLVWSMRSEAVDSSRPQQTIEQQIRLTIAALSRQGLLAR